MEGRTPHTGGKGLQLHPFLLCAAIMSSTGAATSTVRGPRENEGLGVHWTASVQGVAKEDQSCH